MATIEHEAVIGRPAAEVWAILEDVRRLPELSASTVEVRDAPERITATGQSFTQVVQVLGKRFESAWDVTELVPGRALAIEGDVGYGVRYCLRESVEPLSADRCRFGLRITYSLPLGVLGRVASRLGVERRARAEAAEVVAGLKAVAERDGARHRPQPGAGGS
jgi:uncharacterized membrane protein